MKKIEEKISLEIQVTPEQAWDVIAKVKGVELWYSSLIKSCRYENGQRFCETVDGISFKENILEVNSDTKTFRFSIPEQEMLPVENIEETMVVNESKNGKALIEWSASFEATEKNGAIAKEAFKGLWENGLKEMETYIQQQN